MSGLKDLEELRSELASRFHEMNRRFEVLTLWTLVHYVRDLLPDTQHISLDLPDDIDATSLRFGAAHCPGGLTVETNDDDDTSPLDYDTLWDLCGDLDQSIAQWAFAGPQPGGYIEIDIAQAIDHLGPLFTQWFDPAPDLTDTAALDAWLDQKESA